MMVEEPENKSVTSTHPDGRSEVDMERGEYEMKRETDNPEVLMKPLFLPVKVESDFESTSEEIIKEENFEGTKNPEDMVNSEYSVKQNVDIAESLMATSFLPVKAEPDLEQTSEETIMKENFEKNEITQVSMNQTVCFTKEETIDGEESWQYKMIHEPAVLINIKNIGSDESGKHGVNVKFTSEHGTMLLPDLGCPGSYAIASCSTGGLREASHGYLSEVYEEDPITGVKQTEQCEGEGCASYEVTHLEGEKEGNDSLKSSSEGSEMEGRRRPLECSTCQKTFTCKSKLLTHIRFHTGERPYQCSQCDKSFQLSGDLTIHLRSHTGEGPYKCNNCEKTFQQSSHLSQHMRIHTGTKPHKCNQCEKSFRLSGDLTHHMRIHTGERPYQCSQCEKSFQFSGDLTNHMRTHTGERPYKCNNCEKTFQRSCHLSVHMLIHTGKRPYQCNQCEKAFQQSGHLAQHMRIHSGERPYKCSQCEKAFQRSSNLSQHMYSHTTERSYKCSHCEKSFKTGSKLINHMRVHTRERPY